jgi:hypothetical protein
MIMPRRNWRSGPRSPSLPTSTAWKSPTRTTQCSKSFSKIGLKRPNLNRSSMDRSFPPRDPRNVNFMQRFPFRQLRPGIYGGLHREVHPAQPGWFTADLMSITSRKNDYSAQRRANL